MIPLTYNDCIRLANDNKLWFSDTDRDYIKQAIGQLEEEGVPLGYGLSFMTCSMCGHKMTVFHTVPSKRPSECGKCGRMTCYKNVD